VALQPQEMTVEVIVAGMGCKRCRELKRLTEEALRELGAEHVAVRNLDSLEAICQWGIMLLPALMVDGKLLVSGQLPSKKRLLQMFQERLRREADNTLAADAETVAARPTA
jgi:hypothetical protein